MRRRAFDRRYELRIRWIRRRFITCVGCGVGREVITASWVVVILGEAVRTGTSVGCHDDAGGGGGLSAHVEVER